MTDINEQAMREVVQAVGGVRIMIRTQMYAVEALADVARSALTAAERMARYDGADADREAFARQSEHYRVNVLQPLIDDAMEYGRAALATADAVVDAEISKWR